MGLVASMLQDNVTDLKVEIEAEPPQAISLVPKVPRVVFGGQHLILYARIQPKTKVMQNVSIFEAISVNVYFL